MRIDPQRTFRMVIASSSNRCAIALARRAVRRARSAANPLLLYGRSGAGKSLLLAATANRLARHGSAKIGAFTAEEFRNDYVRAIRSGTVASFRRAVDDCVALIVDGLEDLACCPSALEELQRAIRLAIARGHPVVLASALTSTGVVEIMVRSFPLGAIATLRDPTVADRLIALQRLAKRRRRHIPRTSLLAIARSTRSIVEARAKLEAMLLSSA